MYLEILATNNTRAGWMEFYDFKRMQQSFYGYAIGGHVKVDGRYVTGGSNSTSSDGSQYQKGLGELDPVTWWLCNIQTPEGLSEN